MVTTQEGSHRERLGTGERLGCQEMRKAWPSESKTPGCPWTCQQQVRRQAGWTTCRVHGDSHAAANPGPPGTEAEGERLDKWPALCVSCKSVSMTSWKSRAVLKLLKEREAASRWRLQKEHAVAPVKDFLQRDEATKGAVGSRGPAAERRADEMERRPAGGGPAGPGGQDSEASRMLRKLLFGRRGGWRPRSPQKLLKRGERVGRERLLSQSRAL